MNSTDYSPNPVIFISFISIISSIIGCSALISIAYACYKRSLIKNEYEV